MLGEEDELTLRNYRVILRSSRIIMGSKMCFCFFESCLGFLAWIFILLSDIYSASTPFFKDLRVNFHQVDVVFSMNNAPVSVMMGKHPLAVMYPLSTLVLFLS